MQNAYYIDLKLQEIIMELLFNNNESNSDKNIYDIFYMWWKWSFQIGFALLFILIVYRLYKELKGQYIDHFKIMQFTSLIVSWILMTSYYIILFLDPNLSIALRNINQFDKAWVMFFIASNQLWTGTLILHLSKYSKISDFSYYENLRIVIRKYEKI